MMKKQSKRLCSSWGRVIIRYWLLLAMFSKGKKAIMRYGLEEETIQQIQSALAKFPLIDKAVLYGSRAKGTNRKGSDIDLCLFGESLDQKVLYQIETALDDLWLPYTFDL